MCIIILVNTTITTIITVTIIKIMSIGIINHLLRHRYYHLGQYK